MTLGKNPDKLYFAQDSVKAFSKSLVISWTIVEPRVLQATLIRRWRSSSRSRVNRLMVPVFVGGLAVSPETHLSASALLRRGLLGIGAVFFAIKREKFFGEVSYFLGR